MLLLARMSPSESLMSQHVSFPNTYVSSLKKMSVPAQVGIWLGKKLGRNFSFVDGDKEGIRDVILTGLLLVDEIVSIVGNED